MTIKILLLKIQKIIIANVSNGVLICHALNRKVERSVFVYIFNVHFFVFIKQMMKIVFPTCYGIDSKL